MIERWVKLWDRREPPESLALLRILVPLVILADLASALWLGLVPGAWAPPPYGVGWAAVGATPPAAVRFFGATTSTVLALYLTAVVSAACLALGVFSRVAAALLALTTSQLAHIAPDGERGIDILLRIAVLVLAFSRADACWSLAAWWRRRRGGSMPLEVPAWPRLLLFVQVVWVYSSAAHNRGGDAWWPRGELSAIANILSDPHFTRFTPGWVEPFYGLTQAGTALTMVFEFASPLLFVWAWLDAGAGRGGRAGEFVRRFHVKKLWLLVGVMLHLSIAFSMRLGIFSYGMLALYPAFFRPDEIVGAVGRLRCLLRAR
jgi:hypothetical protein